VITATVFLNGDYSDGDFDRRVAAAGQILLAADGGAARLAELGLRPDAVVGDLDSLSDKVARRLAAEGVTFVRFPVRKDQTDAELAVDHAAGLGAGRVILAGALGGMLDHELGHIAVLRRLAQDGIAAELVAPTLWATVLCAPADMTLRMARGRRFSLQALTAEARVSLEGFDYPLSDHPVRADTCLGLGNRVVADEPRVRVHAGHALVMVSGDGSRVEAQRQADSRGAARRETGRG
jgi:thiamine pyrophosphokinase